MAAVGVAHLAQTVGTHIHSFELVFKDGTHVNLPIHKGYVLYQTNPRDSLSGHVPTELVARNAPDHIVGARKLLSIVG